MNNQEQTVVESTNSSNSAPIIELRFKKWLLLFIFVSMFGVTYYLLFGVMIPFLTTGDINEIWPAHRDYTIRKIFVLILSWFYWLCLPGMVHVYRTGNISFYETHVEVIPHLSFFRQRTIPYDALHAIERKRGGFVLINGIVPKLRGDMFNYWKTIYWEGITIPVNGMVLWNPDSHSRAIEIIRERAITITIM